MNAFSPKIHRRRGFTLVELMITVAIIALLAMVAFPSLVKARKTAQLTRLAVNLKTYANNFAQYAADNGKVPFDGALPCQFTSGNDIPPGMATYFPKNSNWTSGADGTWFWCYFPGYLPGYKCYVFLANANLTTEDFTYLDKKLDDGNINTGAVVGLPNFGIVFGVE